MFPATPPTSFLPPPQTTEPCPVALLPVPAPIKEALLPVPVVFPSPPQTTLITAPVFPLPAPTNPFVNAVLFTPPQTTPSLPEAVFLEPDKIAERAPLATCVDDVLDVCKSTALAPLALPPVVVPSGFGPRISAPVPFGVRTKAELVCPACWFVMATFACVVVVASSITMLEFCRIVPSVPSARRMALSTEPAVSGRGSAFAIMISCR